jgi:stage II sporulation protein AA (anti-sigma F factor antagonist)
MYIIGMTAGQPIGGSAMEIVFTKNKNNLIVKPCGEIDHHSSVELRREIDRAYSRSKAKNLIFDFSEVEFMDSSGIGIMIGRYRELAQQGGKVYAININGSVGRIFGISGLSRIIPCFGSLDEALAIAGGK